MSNIQFKIIPYQLAFQPQVDDLILSISKEFTEPISTTNIAKSNLLPDVYLVAMVEEKVVGTISIIKLANENTVLRKMFLHKDFRGQGIANELLQTIINWSIENKLKTIYLGTMTQFKAAQKFYTNFGFEQVEVKDLPNDFPINPVDSLFYKKELNLAI